MSNYQIPFFGTIDIKSPQDYYSTKMKIGVNEVTLDLNFTSKNIDEDTLDVINKFLKNIEHIHKENVTIYHLDLKKGGETSDYINFYLEEFLDDELDRIIDIKQNIESKRIQLLDKLQLTRIGMYPNQESEIGYFGVFDYSIMIDDEYCNQLLVIKTNKIGKLDHITWES